MTTTPRQQIRILHVDDEPDFAELTGVFLEREDDRFTVETATSADEGLERIGDRPPDCVVSDYNMPGMDGIEFLETVRDDHPELPFVLFTGKGSEAVASDAVSAGVTDYLQKKSGSEQYELLANRIQNVVTARRDAEEATRQQDLMKRAEVLGSTGGWELRVEPENLRLTDGIKQIYRVDPDRDLSLEEVIDFYEPDSQRRIREVVDDAIEDGYAEADELRLKTTGGERRIVEGNAELVGDDGNGTLLRGVIRDVTDSTERERELGRLQQAIDNANVSITLADPSQPDDPLVYINDAFERMTGYPPGETLGRNCRFLQGAETDPEKVATLREAIDNEESTSVELRNYRKDGTEFWNRLTVTPIYDDENNLVRYLGTQEDVTGRKERERRLIELNQAIQDLLTAETRQEVAGIGVRTARDVLDLHANAVHLCEADDTLSPIAQTDELVSLIGEVPSLSVADSIAGRVYQRGEPTVAEDVRQDPDVHNAETDLRGHVYLPLAEHGVLIAGSAEERAFGQQDLALGEILAGNLTAALDRVESERTVSRQQQRLSLFFEESPLGAIQWDDEFRVARLNKQAERILGYGEAELRGEPWETIVADEGRDYVGNVVEELLAADGGTHAVNRNVRQDGETRVCKWHNRVVTDADGDVQTIFSKFEDITARKKRELELERYERLLENLPVGVFRTTIDGEIVDMNEATADIFEAETPAQLRGRKPEELYVDGSVRDDLLDRLQETGQVENELVAFETLNGDRRFVRTTITLNEQAENRYVEGILQDVTDRHELEREFAQIKTIAESLNDAVYVLDNDGRFTYVNNEFVELTGYSEGTALGSGPGLIKDEETVREAERQLGLLLSDDGPDNVTFETTIRPKHGDPVVCEDHMGVLPYEGDSFNGSVGILRDITGRKRRERELRRERNRLDEFAGVVTHDLRNPLNVAQGNLELLDSECDADRIERIERAHSRMNDLIDDLLALARQGEVVTDTDPVALGSVAETSWRTVESPRASLDVESDRTVWCDPSRLQQLLENLYRNAVEHGGSDVAVTLGDTDGGFYIEDTGPGIPEDGREQMFEPGYSTATDGTGFGLCIVSQVAEAHGWTVDVAESEATGARFEVTGVEFADR